MRFTITNAILNQTYKFSRVYGALSAQDKNSRWFKKLREVAMQKAGFAAVSVDKSRPKYLDFTGKIEQIDDILNDQELVEYTQYLKVLSELNDLFTRIEDLDIDLLNNIHTRILNLNLANSSKHFRKTTRILPKIIRDNDVYKTVKLEVKTKPHEIESKINDFMEWLRNNFHQMNPLLLAGLCHYKIAEVHPFSDGNGRLSRIFENCVLFLNGIEHYDILPTEDFYLRNRERYYEVLESSISSRDLTEWLELYTEGLLDSVYTAANMLYKISGGTIDIIEDKYMEVTEREEEMIDIFNNQGQASGAEIAKKLNVSRQNIYSILTKMYDRGILKKVGSNTSSRYMLAIST